MAGGAATAGAVARAGTAGAIRAATGTDVIAVGIVVANGARSIAGGVVAMSSGRPARIAAASIAVVADVTV
jgi:hypothetical protein